MKLKSYLSYLIFISLFACAELGQESKSGFQEKMFDGDYAPELVNEAEVFGETVVSQTTEDFCEKLNWYGDGYCDTDCSSPDPDCAKEVANPWVNEDENQVSNESSPWLNPDQQAQEPTDESNQNSWQEEPSQQEPSQQEPSQDPWYEEPSQDPWYEEPSQEPRYEEPSQDPNQASVSDQCLVESDGYCDLNCVNDIDCDVCELYGFYGDGYCDEDCAQPDSDCL